MNRVYLLVMFLPALLGASWCGMASTLPSAGVSAREYVRLRDWAERSNFRVQWIKRDEELRVTGRSGSLVLKVNSTKAEINGIQVFLSFPVVLQNREPCVAATDLHSLITPVLSPARGKPGTRVKTVALCPGHGGRDVGFQAGGYQEKHFTLLLAKEVRSRLEASGFNVVMLRQDDRHVGLEDRARQANRRRADVYLSLHYNSAGGVGGGPAGSEVYCLTLPGTTSTNGGSPSDGEDPGTRNNDRNVLLAYHLQRSLVRNVGLTDRGVRRARFVVLRLAEMPAVLVEAGFMSNPEEMKRIKDPAHRAKTAQAIVDGLIGYKKAIES